MAAREKPPGFARTRRAPELLNYLMGCPGARIRGYALLKQGATIGHFMLSEVHGQTRIADLQVAGDELVDWQNGVLTATEVAARLVDTCEITANSSLDLFSRALAFAGYRNRGEQPIFVLDPGKRLAGARLHICSADYDDFFGWHPEGHFAA
jgi:hypothetical protein